ncbi:MAG: CBS domain-containing protein [Nitrososphaeraceae archaeon]
MQTLKQIDLTREVIKLQPDKTLYDARTALLIYNISRVILAKDDKPLGILTEKDISRFLYEDTSNRNIKEIRLDEVASKELITASEDSDLKTCAKLMIDNKLSSIVIVDTVGNLKGIFTKSDMVDVYAKYYTKKRLVEEYMTKRVFTVDPDETVQSVLLLMVNNKVSRIVVTRNSKPIGIITGRDLLPMSALSDTYFTIYQTNTHEKRVGSEHVEEQFLPKRQKYSQYVPSGVKSIFLAKDVMTHDPITITEDSDLATAARIMSRNRISGIPVINSSENLIGIVTKSDIIKAIYDAN